MSEQAKLEVGGKVYQLPVVVGTEDEHAIDISKLREESGLHHARRWIFQHGLVQQRHHVHRRREGHPAVSRHSRSRNWPRNPRLSRPPIC